MPQPLLLHVASGDPNVWLGPVLDDLGSGSAVAAVLAAADRKAEDGGLAGDAGHGVSSHPAGQGWFFDIYPFLFRCTN